MEGLAASHDQPTCLVIQLEATGKCSREMSLMLRRSKGSWWWDFSIYCETAKVVSPCKKLNVNYFTVLSYAGHYENLSCRLSFTHFSVIDSFNSKFITINVELLNPMCFI